jgi:hypothetical protein
MEVMGRVSESLDVRRRGGGEIVVSINAGGGGIYSSSGTNIFHKAIFKSMIILPYVQKNLGAFSGQFKTHQNFFGGDPPH